MPAHGIVAPTPRVKQLLDHAGCLRILKYMLEQMTDPDRTILALADDSGCFGVERLPPGPASVGDVVEPPAMALSGVLRQWYVDDMCVVDTCGVVKTETGATSRRCQIRPAADHKNRGSSGMRFSVFVQQRIEFRAGRPPSSAATRRNPTSNHPRVEGVLICH